MDFIVTAVGIIVWYTLGSTFIYVIGKIEEGDLFRRLKPMSGTPAPKVKIWNL